MMTTTTTILPFAQPAAFDPEEVRALSAAFDEVCEALKLNGDAKAKEAVAARVIELARRGERNTDRLRTRVLSEANGDAQISDTR